MNNDVRYGLRQIARNPALSAIIIVSLALGIGANTAIFSVVNAVMLRGLPVEDPGGLLAFQYRFPPGESPKALDHTHSGRGSVDSAGHHVLLSISWPSYLYMRERARSVSALVGYVPLGMFDKPSAVVNGEPIFIDGDMVTAGYFPALGVSPILGRAIVGDDERPDAPRVGVISYRFWNRAYARNPAAVGNTITVNGVPVTVVGIASPSFTGVEIGRSPDIWIQMGPRPGLTPWGPMFKEGSPEAVYGAPDFWWLEVVARSKPGVAIDDARRELDRLFRESLLATIDSPVPADKLPAVSLTPAAQGLNLLSRQLSKPLWILSVSVALVLLVACANVATLLLARANGRRKEMSVRLAMGAPRARLVRQLLTESLVYGAAGAVLGLLLAIWGSNGLLTLLSDDSNPIPLDIGVDATVLLFTAAIALATTVLFGLVPAIGATRLNLAVDLKENAGTARGESGAVRLRGSKTLVVAQLALSLPLVVGAGLFLRTLGNLQHQPLGFNPDRLLLFSIDPTKAGFKDARLVTAFGDLQARIAALPGVRGVTASRLGLMTGVVSNGSISLERPPANFDQRRMLLYRNYVAPAFFETMGMTLVLGRRLDARDTAEAARVAVVNETMAKQFFPGESPLGERFWAARTRTGQPIEIVGVVRDAKYASLREPAPPTAYMPFAQEDRRLAGMIFEVRTSGDPLALVAAVRKVAADVAPGVPLADVKTQAQQIEESLGEERAYARLFTFFGAIALLLACVGLYGTLTYALGRRTREIGIRMALGATRERVLAAVLLETIVMAFAGMIAGGAVAWAGVRYVRSLLFEVTALDARTLAVTVAVILGVALAAGYRPARRASRLDPLTALREE